MCLKVWFNLLQDLFQQAVSARDQAYAPNSQFKVGAAILAKANELLLAQMERERLLTAEQISLFRDPALVLAGKLVAGFKQIVRARPLIIALDNLEANQAERSHFIKHPIL